MRAEQSGPADFALALWLILADAARKHSGELDDLQVDFVLGPGWKLMAMIGQQFAGLLNEIVDVRGGPAAGFPRVASASTIIENSDQTVRQDIWPISLPLAYWDKIEANTPLDSARGDACGNFLSVGSSDEPGIRHYSQVALNLRALRFRGRSRLEQLLDAVEDTPNALQEIRDEIDEELDRVARGVPESQERMRELPSVLFDATTANAGEAANRRLRINAAQHLIAQARVRPDVGAIGVVPIAALVAKLAEESLKNATSLVPRATSLESTPPSS